MGLPDGFSRAVSAAVAYAPRSPFVVERVELEEPRDDELLVRIVTTGCASEHARLGARSVP
jgi:Zn-dependent alcohol dehydrogenase